MGKRLVIAEKPSVALDIANAFGPYESGKDNGWYETADFVITFAVGHLLELMGPEDYNDAWQRWTLKELPMLPGQFKRVARDKKATTRLKLIGKLAKRKEIVGLINACDAGREGEHIFRTIVTELDVDLPMERLWLSSMTTGAIREGFKNLIAASEKDNLGAAAASRSEADWLIGMNATRALSIRLKSFKYQGAWSAGRVQTPTLAMCVKHELKIQQHVPRTYWEIPATFAASDHSYEAMYRLDADACEDGKNPTRIFDAAHKDAVLAGLAAATSARASEVRTRSSEKPPLPLDLTTLQRETHMTAKRTQSIAQALYERHKLISYPRTDSRFLPTDQRPQLGEVLRMLGGLKSLRPVVDRIQSDQPQNLGRVFNDKGVTDHHAIVPVGVPSPGQLDDGERRVYELVARRFLAAFMPPSQWEKVVRTTVVVSDAEYAFRSTGKRLVEPGWQLAMGKEVGHGSSLQALDPATDAPVTLTGHEAQESETKPPGRLTDGPLLRYMETCGKEIEDAELGEAMGTRGLGTPATRADTIERLIGRGYLARDGGKLRATAKALRLLDVLQRVGAARLTSPELTGEMEHKLAQVEQGQLSRADYMTMVVENTSEITSLLVALDFDELYGSDEPVGYLGGEGGQPVVETAFGYAIDDGEEPFFLWKDVRGHALLRDEVRRMLDSEDGRIGPITLYPMQGGGRGGYVVHLRLRRRTDEEYAKLLDKKPTRAPSRWFVEIESTQTQETDSDEERIGPFLVTPAGVQIVETTTRWADTDHLEGERPKAVLAKVVCKREMSADEARKFFMEGQTDWIDGFISKRGRPFRARLILKENGRCGFEFEPRKPRKPKAKAATKADA